MDNVRGHAKLLFNRGGSNIDLAVPGTFRLVPDRGLERVLEQDYRDMRGMLFGNVPSWEQIMAGINRLETELNHGGGDNDLPTFGR